MIKLGPVPTAGVSSTRAKAAWAAGKKQFQKADIRQKQLLLPYIIAHAIVGENRAKKALAATLHEKVDYTDQPAFLLAVALTGVNQTRGTYGIAKEYMFGNPRTSQYVGYELMDLANFFTLALTDDTGITKSAFQAALQFGRRQGFENQMEPGSQSGNAFMPAGFMLASALSDPQKAQSAFKAGRRNVGSLGELCSAFMIAQVLVGEKPALAALQQSRTIKGEWEKAANLLSYALAGMGEAALT